jgi:hypothetical protein
MSMAETKATESKSTTSLSNAQRPTNQFDGAGTLPTARRAPAASERPPSAIKPVGCTEDSSKLGFSSQHFLSFSYVGLHQAFMNRYTHKFFPAYHGMAVCFCLKEAPVLGWGL